LLVYLVLRPVSVLNTFIIGLVLGLLIVTRPFYLTWALASVGGLLALRVLFWLASKHRLAGLRAVRWRRLALIGLALAVPLMLIVGAQVALVAEAEGTPGLTGQEARGWIHTHMMYGLFYYKYETYTYFYQVYAGRVYVPQIHYINAAREAQFKGQESWLAAVAADPLGFATHTALKTVGMFQAYEWTVYRSTIDDNPLHPLFLMGFVNFAALVYCVMSLGWQALRHPRTLISAQTSLLLVVLVHLLGYSVPTIPEPRFIAPILPLVMALTVATFSVRRDRWTLATAVTVGLVLYAVAHAVITPTLRMT
jgi:hypothetical protein